MNNDAQRFRKRGTFHDYMLVIFGYERIYGFEGGGIERVVREAAEFNLYSLLETISKIGLSLYSKGFSSKQNQIQLVRNIFAEDLDIRKRIYDLLVREGISEWAIFGEQPLLCLLKIILEHCPKEGGKLVYPKDVGQVGKWLLILTDACMPSERQAIILPPALQIEQLREFVARQHFFMARERLPYRFARFGQIFSNIQKLHPELDISKLFEEATEGISLEDYRRFCFYLLVNWVNKTTKEVDITKEWIVCKKKYFKKTALDIEEVNRITKLLLLDIGNYSKNYHEFVYSSLKSKDIFPYNFLLLRQRPLIQFNNECFVCPDPNLLMDKATEGVYWIIENYIKSTSKDKWEKWPVIWGSAFEKYVHERLEGAFGKKYQKGIFKDTEERSDGVFIGDEVIFFIEIKYAHWSQKAKFTGFRNDMMPTAQQLFSSQEKCKGLGQIVRDIKDVESAKLKLPFDLSGRKIIPLIIVGEPMPMEPLNRNMYGEIAAKSGAIYIKENILPFIVLDAEELEMLEAIATNNGTDVAEKLLIEYSKTFSTKNIYGSSEKAMEFKNYLHSIGFPVPNNESVLSLFDDLAESSRLKAFPKSKFSLKRKRSLKRSKS